MTDNIRNDRFYNSVRTYYAVTYGSVFDKDTTRKLTRIISKSNGLDGTATLLGALDELESHNVTTYQACVSYLSATMLLPDFSSEFRTAAEALRDFLETDKSIRIYRDKNIWLKDIFKAGTSTPRLNLIKAVELWAEGDVKSALIVLETIAKSGTEYSEEAERFFAALALDCGFPELAFSSVIRTEFIYRPDQKEWVWYENENLKSIKFEAATLIGAQKASEIINEARSSFHVSQKIGFA